MLYERPVKQAIALCAKRNRDTRDARKTVRNYYFAFVIKCDIYYQLCIEITGTCKAHYQSHKMSQFESTSCICIQDDEQDSTCHGSYLSLYPVIPATPDMSSRRLADVHVAVVILFFFYLFIIRH